MHLMHSHDVGMADPADMTELPLHVSIHLSALDVLDGYLAPCLG